MIFSKNVLNPSYLRALHQRPLQRAHVPRVDKVRDSAEEVEDVEEVPVDEVLATGVGDPKT